MDFFYIFIIFSWICFSIFTFLITDCPSLLSLDSLNKLGFFPKLVKNSITFVIFDIFLSRANYAISKNAT